GDVARHSFAAAVAKGGRRERRLGEERRETEIEIENLRIFNKIQNLRRKKRVLGVETEKLENNFEKRV
ncbi:hypothetical protein Dimus_018178, partial [Dionaea muscipula]